MLPDADEANIFVVRADGSVVHSRDSSSGFFNRSTIESLELAPGDTVELTALSDAVVILVSLSARQDGP